LPAKPKGRSFLGDPPGDLDELKGFPDATLAAGTVLYRVHRAIYGPWFFSTDAESRFTPAGMPTHGACYWASQRVAALLEALRGERRKLVPEDEVLERRISTAQLDREVRVADLAHQNAGRFGVNAEVHTTPDYDKTQAWAAAFTKAGFEGLRYLCRSDPSVKLVGWALFDRAGPSTCWPDPLTEEIDDDLIDEAAEYGLKLLPTP
jgi:hypothetical protein